jgi:hypothetical protein
VQHDSSTRNAPDRTRRNVHRQCSTCPAKVHLCQKCIATYILQHNPSANCKKGTRQAAQTVHHQCPPFDWFLLQRSAMVSPCLCPTVPACCSHLMSVTMTKIDPEQQQRAAPFWRPTTHNTHLIVSVVILVCTSETCLNFFQQCVRDVARLFHVFHVFFMFWCEFPCHKTIHFQLEAVQSVGAVLLF